MSDKSEDLEPSSGTGDTYLDSKMLRTIRELTEPGESDFLDELIKLFTDRSPNIIKEIHEAFDSGDSVKMSRSAHSLKGSCGNLGIKKLMVCCDGIEQLGIQNRVTEAAPLVSDLEHIYKQSINELLTWKSQF